VSLDDSVSLYDEELGVLVELLELDVKYDDEFDE
jgi:hypothetical protein